jgi:hypothetical protein
VTGTPPATGPQRRALALIAVAALCFAAVLALRVAPALAARPQIVKPRADALVVKPQGRLQVEVAAKGKGSRPRAEIDGRQVAAHFRRAGKAWTAALPVSRLATGDHTLTTLDAAGVDTTHFIVGRRAPGAVRFTWHTGWRKRGTKLLVVRTKKRLSRYTGYPKVFLNGRRVDKNVRYGELGRGFVGGFGPNVGLRYGRNRVRVQVLLEDGAFATARRSFVVHRNRPLAGAGPDRRTSVGEPVTLDGSSTQVAARLLSLTPAPKATGSAVDGPAAAASDTPLVALRPVPAEFEWKVINGPPGPEPVIEEDESEEPIFIPEIPGTYEIEELVKPEGGGTTGIDTVTVNAPQTTSPMGIPIQTITSTGAIQIGEESHPRKSPGVKMLVLSGTELKPIAWPGRWGAAEHTFTAEPNGEWESPDEKGKKGQLVEEVKHISPQQTVILTGQGTGISGSPLSKSQVAHLEEAIELIGGTVAHSGQTPLGAADLENGDWSVVGYIKLTEGHGNQNFGLGQDPLPAGTTFEFPKFPATSAGSPGSLNGFMQRIGTLAYDFVSPEFLSLNTKWTSSPGEAPSPTQNTIAVGSNHYASATIPDGAVAMQLLVLDGSEPTEVLENATYTILSSSCRTVDGPNGIATLDHALHDWATEGGAAGAPGSSNIVIAQDFGHQTGECWPGGNDPNWLQDAMPKISGDGSGWNGSKFPTKRSETIPMWNNPNVHGWGSVAGNFGIFAGTTAHDMVANYRRPFWDTELGQRINRDYGGLTLVASTNLYQPSAAYFQGQGESTKAANPTVPAIDNGTVTGVLRRNEQSQWELQSSAQLAGATDKEGKYMAFEQSSLLELMFSKPTPWPCSVESPAPCKGTKAEIEAAQKYFVKLLAPEGKAPTVRDLYATEYSREQLSEVAVLHPYPSKNEQIILGGGEFSRKLYETMQKGEPEGTWKGLSGEVQDVLHVAKGIKGWRQVFEGGSNSSVAIDQAGEEVIKVVNEIYDKLKKENKEEEMNGAIAASFLDMVSYLVDVGVAASGNPEAIPFVAPTLGALGAMIDVGDDAADIYGIYGESSESEVPNDTEAIRGKVTDLSTEIATRYLHIAQTMGHFGAILVDDPEKLRLAGDHFSGEGIWALPEAEEMTLREAMVNSVQRAAFETTLPMAFVQWVTSPARTDWDDGSAELPQALSYQCPDTHNEGGTRNPWPQPSKKGGNPIWSMYELGWSGGGPTAGTNMTPQNSQNYVVRGLKSSTDDMHPERTETENGDAGYPGLGHTGTMASPFLMEKVFATPNPHVFSMRPEGLGVSKEEMFGLEDWSIRKFGCGEPH